MHQRLALSLRIVVTYQRVLCLSKDKPPFDLSASLTLLRFDIGVAEDVAYVCTVEDRREQKVCEGEYLNLCA